MKYMSTLNIYRAYSISRGDWKVDNGWVRDISVYIELLDIYRVYEVCEYIEI